MIDMLSGLFLGLVGSLHCVGMCGPLVLALPLTRRDRVDIATKSLVYNFGRIITYGILGLLMGVLGWCLQIGGLQQLFSIILGFTLLYTALSSIFPAINLKNKIPKVGFLSKIGQKVKNMLVLNTNSNAVKIGMLNGLLPCGLVYIALANSVTQANPFYSGIYMMIFGIGTIPLMFLVMFGGNLYKGFTARLRRFIPLAIGLLGIYLIYRGVVIHLTENPDAIASGLVKFKCH